MGQQNTTVVGNKPPACTSALMVPRATFLDDYDPFARPCKDCTEKHEQIHVITHECLEGDALRCVIKAVPDNVLLEPEDYVRVGDILKLLQEADADNAENADAATTSTTDIETKTKDSLPPSWTGTLATSTARLAWNSTATATVITIIATPSEAKNSTSSTSPLSPLSSSSFLSTFTVSSSNTSTTILPTSTPTTFNSSLTSTTPPNTQTIEAPPGGWPVQRSSSTQLTPSDSISSSPLPSSPAHISISAKRPHRIPDTNINNGARYKRVAEYEPEPNDRIKDTPIKYAGFYARANPVPVGPARRQWRTKTPSYHNDDLWWAYVMCEQARLENEEAKPKNETSIANTGATNSTSNSSESDSASTTDKKTGLGNQRTRGIADTIAADKALNKRGKFSHLLFGEDWSESDNDSESTVERPYGQYTDYEDTNNDKIKRAVSIADAKSIVKALSKRGKLSHMLFGEDWSESDNDSESTVERPYGQYTDYEDTNNDKIKRTISIADAKSIVKALDKRGKFSHLLFGEDWSESDNDSESTVERPYGQYTDYEDTNDKTKRSIVIADAIAAGKAIRERQGKELETKTKRSISIADMVADDTARAALESKIATPSHKKRDFRLSDGVAESIAEKVALGDDQTLNPNNKFVKSLRHFMEPDALDARDNVVGNVVNTTPTASLNPEDVTWKHAPEFSILSLFAFLMVISAIGTGAFLWAVRSSIKALTLRNDEMKEVEKLSNVESFKDDE
ncbi:hypothetical protein P280DRAFT_505962 [Massarina eburnea CBS 473.64]|uniref:Uncharacterized protein n=1 Tax=Massarina eburnea CBS 473.64 TaxID=1395130 RepID=A0A6A6S751_9PLEO|nr:hypothetical protein P280DRAFT_505962 [Massarina eburnea CBS 473.64]